MTCKQVGDACAIEFFGETFEEIAAQSKQVEFNRLNTI
jgi:hypothetical protein